MHANAYLTGLQAPSFTTPEPVDLQSTTDRIASLSPTTLLPPDRVPLAPLAPDRVAPRLDGIPGLFDGQRSLTFYHPSLR